MRKVFVWVWVVGMTHIGLYAQPCNYQVNGYVYDRSNEQPLPFASVQIEGSNRGTSTDLDGYFEISGLCESEVHLTISMLGYKTIIHHHDAYHETPIIYLADDSMLLESITVEGKSAQGEFFSTSGQSLSSRQIEKYGDKAFGELLAHVSGVNSISTGSNVVKPMIHGLHSNRILIIDNDLRHEFQNWGIEHAPEIDASNVDELAVIKGAAAVKYGSDALAGVIQVRSAQPRLHEGFYGKAKSSAYSNGLGVNGSLLTGYGWERFALQAQASFRQNGDLSAPDYSLSNTGMKEHSVNIETVYHGKSTELEGQYMNTYQKLSILRASVNESFDDLIRAIESDYPLFETDFTRNIAPPYQEVSHQLVKLKATYRKGGNVLTALYGYQFNNRKEVDLRRGSSSLIPSIDLDLATHSFDLEWSLPSLGGWMISVGSQSLVQDNNNLPGTGTVPFVPNFNNYRSGLFAIASKEVDQNVWEAGIRYDYQYTSIRGREPDNAIYRHTLNFQNVTGSLGWVRSVNDVHSIRVNFGTAWRPPNIYELYSFGKHQNAIEYGLWRYEWEPDNVLTAGQVLDPNDNPVKSELGLKGIVTWEGKYSVVSWELTGYANQISNYLYSRPAGLTNTVRGVFPYFIFDQTNALFTGADLDVVWKHTSSINSTVSGSYVYATDLNEGSYFNAVPPATLRHELVWSEERNMRLIEFSVSNQFVARQYQQPMIIDPRAILESYETGDNLVTQDTPLFDLVKAPSAYWLLGANARYEQAHWIVSMKVDNLFNQSYRRYTDRLRYFADQPGRNFLFSFTYRW